MDANSAVDASSSSEQMDVSFKQDEAMEPQFGQIPSLPGQFPTAGLKACMAAMSKIWKMTGPDFYFEMINDSTPLLKGDFVITVIFHLKDRPKLVEVEMTPGQKRLDMPELCSSFLVAVAEEDELDLITFDEIPAPEPTTPPPAANPSNPDQPAPELSVIPESHQTTTLQVTAGPKKRARPVAFELFGDGSDVGVDPVTGQKKGIKWGLITPEVEAMSHLRIISTASFRHVYSDARVQKVFNRDECLKRCALLAGHTPFPMVLVETNLDLLANGLMVGWLPEICPDDFALVMEDHGLTKGFITREQFERKADYDHRLKMTKKRLVGVMNTAYKLKTLHHLTHLSKGLRIGHLGIIIESSIVVGGAAYDAVYDPNNLVKNAKRRSKLGIASTVGAAVGGGIGILIPIPGLFVLMSMGGSVAGRWIAGKFITEDGVEHEDVVPVGRLRQDEDDGVLEVVQELDEEESQWMVTWNNIQNKVGLGDAPKSKEPGRAQSSPPSFWDRVTGSGASRNQSMPVVHDGDLLSFDASQQEQVSGAAEKPQQENAEAARQEEAKPQDTLAAAKKDDDEEVSKRPQVVNVPSRQLMMGSPDTSAPKPKEAASSSSWWPLGGASKPAPPKEPPSSVVPVAAASAPALVSGSGGAGGTEMKPSSAAPVAKPAPPTTPAPASTSSSSSWWGLWGGSSSTSAPAAEPPKSPAVQQQPPPPKPSVPAPQLPKSNDSKPLLDVGYAPAPMPVAPGSNSAKSLLGFDDDSMAQGPSLLSFVEEEKPAQLLSFDDDDSFMGGAPKTAPSAGSLLSFE